MVDFTVTAIYLVIEKRNRQLIQKIVTSPNRVCKFAGRIRFSQTEAFIQKLNKFSILTHKKWSPTISPLLLIM